MTDKIIEIKVKDSDEGKEESYIEQVDLLVVRAKELATKHDISLSDAISILECRNFLAVVRLIGEAVIIFNSEYDKSLKSREK